MSVQNFINYKEFENVDIRIGTVIEAYEYNELKNKYMLLQEISRTLIKIYFNIVRNPNL